MTVWAVDLYCRICSIILFKLLPRRGMNCVVGIRIFYPNNITAAKSEKLFKF